jgi:2-oxo-3-hexenedioate decarboxylase
MSPDPRRHIAAELLDALDHGRIVASVVERHPELDWDAGYAIAAEIVKLRRARGERTVGRKIGFTNRNIWPEYGATAPIWAHVYEDTLIHARDNAATLSLAGSVQPRIEPEIAFKLCAPLPAGCNDPATILQSLEWLAPSFEIVDCHFQDWRFKPADAAADFSLHWRLIIGTPYAIRRDEIATLVSRLRDCQVTLRRDGTITDRGVGANALGHPALALAFLADIVARQPQFDPLTAGEVVTTGTLTAALPIAPGETWTTDYTGLPISGLTIGFTT